MRYGVDALPHVRYMYKKAELGVCLLRARRQNLSRLRVEKLGCAGSRQVIPAVYHEFSTGTPVSMSCRLPGHRVPLAYSGCNFAWSLLTKGVIAGIGKRRCARGTADPLPRLTLARNRRLYLPTQGS
jgi:hypothetical protein